MNLIELNYNVAQAGAVEGFGTLPALAAQPGPKVECTCRVIVLPHEHGTPCPLHVSFYYKGALYRRCGDSDVTGSPYFVGGALEVIR